MSKNVRILPSAKPKKKKKKENNDKERPKKITN